MTGKVQALKDLIFYADENPTPLAETLANLIVDVVTSIRISGDKKILVPTEDSVSVTYVAEALSQYKDKMEDEVTLSLKEEVEGVSLSDSTVTIASTVVADSFILKAECGSVTAEYRVALIAPNT